MTQLGVVCARTHANVHSKRAHEHAQDMVPLFLGPVGSAVEVVARKQTTRSSISSANNRLEVHLECIDTRYMYNSTYRRTIVHANTYDHLNVDVYILAFIHTGQAFYTVALIRGDPKKEEKEEQEARAWLRNSQEKLQVLFNDFFF